MYKSKTEIYKDAISIHAPREGDDFKAFGGCLIAGGFQSTPPARGTTTPDGHAIPLNNISIHAPREGDDVSAYFYKQVFLFQSTPPARGTTLV